MEHAFNTLSILAEMTVGFVAFSAIVASLRVTLGAKLTAFQNLLVHFFTEVGMLTISILMLPQVLWGFWPDESTVSWYTMLYTLVATGLYLAFYIRRRLKVGVPTPFWSLMVMIGYAIWLPFLAIVLSGIYWQPTLAIVAAYCLWALCSSAVVFVSFLATFVDYEESD